jgi:hypothetical protein
VLEVPEDGEYIPVIAGAQCLGPMRVDLASLGWRDRPLAVKGGVPTP